MSEQSREWNNRAQTLTYCTILWTSIGEMWAISPSFPVCLTLNLAARMRRGAGGGRYGGGGGVQTKKKAWRWSEVHEFKFSTGELLTVS